jgi:glucosamine--fructose-6-phosphate aminotransferase (isomerizing)
MCGIVGYIGHREAQPVLLNCLGRLEYRGYDSCGIAIPGNGIEVYKDAVRVAQLEKSVPQNGANIGIGHTRWATHGKPSQINAHPHTDCDGRIAVVHNGVVYNFQRLKDQLVAEGHTFRSETDTEVIPHLIEKYYRGDLEEAVKRSLLEINGSYAIVVLDQGSHLLVAARKESPLIIGIGDREWFIASDVPAILGYTDRVIYLEDGDVAVVTPEEERITNDGKEVAREEHLIPWSIDEAEKSGYEHFLIKEIHEQPKAIQNTLRGYLSAVEPAIELGVDIDADDILILGCGTSYHAGLVGKYIIEELSTIPVRVEIASEFNYDHTVLGKTLVIGITQSGESADTLLGLKKAKRLGNKTMVITNVLGSSATRIADQVFYIRAGPEISVAATKSFTAQLVALYLIALSAAKIELKGRASLVEELRKLPVKVQRILDEEEKIAQLGRYVAGFDHAFFVARGINFPIALEGALKLKEISYIHAEGYPAGELKHGPFALLTPHTPVIAIAAKDDTYEAVLTNIKEIKARESPVIAVAEESDDEIEKYVDFVIKVPGVEPIFSPVVNSVALQLLAYYAARERGCPIDMPRNLAKSVTVE